MRALANTNINMSIAASLLEPIYIELQDLREGLMEIRKTNSIEKINSEIVKIEDLMTIIKEVL